MCTRCETVQNCTPQSRENFFSRSRCCCKNKKTFSLRYSSNQYLRKRKGVRYRLKRKECNFSIQQENFSSFTLSLGKINIGVMTVYFSRMIKVLCVFVCIHIYPSIAKRSEWMQFKLQDWWRGRRRREIRWIEKWLKLHRKVIFFAFYSSWRV